MREILFNSDEFSKRHNSVSESDEKAMLDVIGFGSTDELIDNTIPDSIRLQSDMDLDLPLTETQFLESFKKISSKNKKFKTYIGMGYYDCITPSVIKRNILENPGWYTAYTPYQAEIAQGRLEALINYQTMVCDMTGMEIANASLLDEGTAASEAMTMFYRLRKGEKKLANKFFVSEKSFPQTIELMKTRSTPLGIELVIGDINNFEFSDDFFGIFLQYPDSDGNISDISKILENGELKQELIFTSEIIQRPLNLDKSSIEVDNSLSAFLVMGFFHILSGWDHIAFIVGLVLLFTRLSLFYAITGFTIGHSATLFLGSANIITVDIKIVDAVLHLYFSRFP